MTDNWSHTRQIRDLETCDTLCKSINSRLGSQIHPYAAALGWGFVFAYLLFQVIIFQSLALSNHLDYMCISGEASWGQWLFMWAQMEAGAESLWSPGVRGPVGRAWVRRRRQPDESSERNTNRSQQPPLSGLSSILYFSVRWLNSISVSMMDSCRLVLEI